jgi:uncharacterized membrane protein
MRRIVVVLSLLVSLLGTLAGQASAQVPPHDHLLTVPGTGSMVQVAPPRCALGETVQGAFLNFHFNVHMGIPLDIGGLEITPRPCT